MNRSRSFAVHCENVYDCREYFGSIGDKPWSILTFSPKWYLGRSVKNGETYLWRKSATYHDLGGFATLIFGEHT